MNTSPTLARPTRRHTSGFRLRRLRDAQFIPLGWEHLTAVDVEHIRARVDATLAKDTATLFELEAAMLLWASLITGRTAAELLPLGLRRVWRGESVEDQAPGLLKLGERWGWWLRAAAPSQQGLARVGRHRLRTWSPSVWLPATSKLASLINRCLRLRREVTKGPFMTGASLSLFQHGASLIGAITDLLAERDAGSGGQARRATTTPEAVARWLPAALAHAAGGDVVPSSIACGRVGRAGETAIHYGSVSLRDIAMLYERAIEGLDELTASPKFLPVLNTSAGDRLTPTDNAVSAAAAKLSSDLGAHGLTLVERHRAMMRYTVALLSFALAHRVRFGTMPPATGVDAETGFVWISDKKLRGAPTTRLVWVCDIAWKQLQLYERHLDQVQASLGAAASELADLRGQDQLALFSIEDAAITPVTVYSAVSEAMHHAGLPLANAGRHWLRAALVGRCSTETLHAFYGHGLLEDGVWDWAGGLDPCAYRADLARALDPVMERVGWLPRAPGPDGNTAA